MACFTKGLLYFHLQLPRVPMGYRYSAERDKITYALWRSNVSKAASEF